MLAHYGGLTSQIVTPLFRDDALAAVLSVHSLNKLRRWSAAEIAFARDAASLMGQLIGAIVQ
jgi:GAF domain-containing protein